MRRKRKTWMATKIPRRNLRYQEASTEPTWVHCSEVELVRRAATRSPSRGRSRRRLRGEMVSSACSPLNTSQRILWMFVLGPIHYHWNTTKYQFGTSWVLPEYHIDTTWKIPEHRAYLCLEAIIFPFVVLWLLRFFVKEDTFRGCRNLRTLSPCRSIWISFCHKWQTKIQA